jgi:hypothetical protein
MCLYWLMAKCIFISHRQLMELGQRSQYSNWLRAGRGVRARVLVGVSPFCLPLHPDQFWGPLSLLSNGYHRLFLQGGKMAGMWSWPLTSNYCRRQEYVDLYIHSATLALAGGEWPDSRPGRFTPQGKSSWYPFDSMFGRPQVWSGWHGENSWPYQDYNSNPLIVQPVASHYTDYATPILAPSKWPQTILNYS